MPLKGIDTEGLRVFDSPEYLQAQIPSAGAKCSARGLAKLAAAMANGGQIQGQTVLGRSAMEAVHADPVERSMIIMQNSFTQGGLAQFKESDAAKGPLEAALARAAAVSMAGSVLADQFFSGTPNTGSGSPMCPLPSIR